MTDYCLRGVVLVKLSSLMISDSPPQKIFECGLVGFSSAVAAAAVVAGAGGRCF